MARHAGKNGTVYMSTSGAVAASVIVMAGWDANFTTQKVDVTSFRDPNKVQVIGIPDMMGNFNGFWDDAASGTLFTASRSVTPINLYLYPDIVANPLSYVYAPAWIDFVMKVAVGGGVDISGTWTAGGAGGVVGI